jgi:hypothetical protein
LRRSDAAASHEEALVQTSEVFPVDRSAFGHSLQGLGKLEHMKMLPAIVNPKSPHRPATMNGPVMKRKEKRNG